MKSTIVLQLLSCLSFCTVSAYTNYHGYHVYRVKAGPNAPVIHDVIEDLSLRTWETKSGHDGFADVVVPLQLIATFVSRTGSLEKRLMHEDLGVSIAQESQSSDYIFDVPGLAWFRSYHNYTYHLQFLQELQTAFSNQSKIFSVGTSLEGQEIVGLHFWGSEGPGKPAVVFHSTAHAREWISTMVNEYMAYILITSYASNQEIRDFVDKYDFYILPVVNPDGFVYTQQTDRFWRKNRQNTSNSTCIGRDINRNWDYKWDLPNGASTNPCNDAYKGAFPSDAPETQALANHTNHIAQTQGLKLYIDWHSYSQAFMTPYGYDCTALPPNNTELQALAKGAIEALKAENDVDFTHGPVCSTMYQISGGSIDYVQDVVRADYAFVVELRDRGFYGFVLPPEQILTSCTEAFEAVRYLLKNMR